MPRATLAVVLARGLGSRLQADDGSALAPAQAQAAARGSKGLMPLNGRPLLDYVLHELADGGVTDVVFVVAPDDDAIARRYEHDVAVSRLDLRYAVQREPRGTADALLAARDAVEAACGVRPKLPEWLGALNERPERITVLPADQAAVERFVSAASRAAQEGVPA